jgi:amidase
MLRAVSRDLELDEASIARLGAAMADGRISALELTQEYLERIERLDRGGPRLRSVLEANPEALEIAERLDGERAAGRVRGPLHGIPVLLKDNIDTADRMLTTAGSLALSRSRPARDATVAARLREAGAVILGKANLSEWANFRSTRSASGWSGRGGLCGNPYVLDRTPCGSSSGSAAAVSANLAAAALGTETDGSVVCPASACGVVGIKPTVGLTSRAGVIPIAHSQDSVGVHGRTVADAAAMLAAIAGPDPRDAATAEARSRTQPDYTRFLDDDGLQGARIGVPRDLFFGYSEHTDRIAEAALDALREAGAVIVDPADISTAKEMRDSGPELEILLYELKADLNAYLAERGDPEVGTLADLIAFNQAHADQELRFFQQEHFVAAQAKGGLAEPEYIEALARSHRLSRAQGLDAVLDEHRLDALFAPTLSPPWVTDLVNGNRPLGSSSQPAALAGYPLVTVPAGFAFDHLPVGVTFMGRAWSEPVLVRLAHAFERATHARRVPKFLPTLPID